MEQENEKKQLAIKRLENDLKKQEQELKRQAEQDVKVGADSLVCGKCACMCIVGYFSPLISEKPVLWFCMSNFTDAKDFVADLSLGDDVEGREYSHYAHAQIYVALL